MLLCHQSKCASLLHCFAQGKSGRCLGGLGAGPICILRISCECTMLGSFCMAFCYVTTYLWNHQRKKCIIHHRETFIDFKYTMRFWHIFTKNVLNGSLVWFKRHRLYICPHLAMIWAVKHNITSFVLPSFPEFLGTSVDVFGRDSSVPPCSLEAVLISSQPTPRDICLLPRPSAGDLCH